MSGRLGRLLGHFLFLSLLAVVVSGCPALLKDDFQKGAGGDASVGGSAGTGGTGGTSGTSGTSGSAGADASAGSDAGGAAGDAGQDADAEASSCAGCKAGQTCCDNACVDTNSDMANCGSCGHGCKGTICSFGSCTNTCAAGFLNCDQNITNGCEVNAATDVNNCGSCGTKCGLGATCESGSCVCPAGSADCNGNPADGCETDITTDPKNCGACGKSCGANEVCTNGKCGCATGFADCNQNPNDGCEVDTTSDPLHCGSCGNDCGPNTTCSGGTCGCTAGYLDCTSAPGCETAATDPNNCGSCGHVCSGSTTFCDGTTCQASCNATVCGSSCVDTQTDPNNCGGCGKAVGPNQYCANGTPTCIAGFADCNGNPTDGCETDTRTDSSHCGTCPNACKPGAICNNSVCQCAAATPKDCGATCEQCCGNSDCSDGNGCTTDTCVSGKCTYSAPCPGGATVCCGQLACYQCCSDSDCTNNQVCSGHVCVTPTCTPSQALCNGTCVDIQTDAKNCGGCGNDCGVGRTCSSGSCTPPWVMMPASPLGGRDKAAYAWTGTEVFIWGGENANKSSVDDGELYDPATNVWSMAGTKGTRPSARVLPTAVWTGSVVVVWGGGDVAGTTLYNDGSRYNPATGSWAPMTTSGAPTGRLAPFGAWTGSRVLFWGGYDNLGSSMAGAWLYDPVNDTWTAAPTGGADPGALGEPAIGFSGTNLYVYGGKPLNANLTGYDPANNVWTPLAGGWSERYGSFGSWDGTYFIVWGGQTSGQPNAYADGRRYDPAGDSWTAMSASGPPTARWAPHRQTGWTAHTSSGTTLILGGLGPKKTDYRLDGALYDSTSNAWTAVPPWPSGETHLFGVGVWTGTEFVLWGGQNNAAATNTGERFRP